MMIRLAWLLLLGLVSARCGPPCLAWPDADGDDLLARLASSDEAEQRAAAGEAARRAVLSEALVTALVRLVDADQEETRATAALALNRHRAGVVRPLVELFRRSGYADARAALWGLSRLEPPPRAEVPIVLPTAATGLLPSGAALTEEQAYHLQNMAFQVVERAPPLLRAELEALIPFLGDARAAVRRVVLWPVGAALAGGLASDALTPALLARAREEPDELVLADVFGLLPRLRLEGAALEAALGILGTALARPGAAAEAAAEALYELRTHLPAARRLLAGVGSSDRRVRQHAWHLLEDRGDGAEIEAALLSMLGSPDPAVRAESGQRVAGLRDDRPLPERLTEALVSALADPDAGARCCAAGALCSRGVSLEEAVPVLERALAGDDDELAAKAALFASMAVAGSARARALVLRALDDRRPGVATFALQGLLDDSRKGKNGFALTVLARRMADDAVLGPWAALLYVESGGEPSAPLPHLVWLAQTPSFPDMRERAGEALVRIGAPAKTHLPALRSRADEIEAQGSDASVLRRLIRRLEALR